MKILVSGASGFLGWRVSLALREAGHQVKALFHGKAIRRTEIPAGIELAWGSVDEDSWHEDALRDVEGVVHCAWDSRMYPEARFRRTNLTGALRLFAAAEAAGVLRFIHVSSVAVYGLAPLPGGRPMDESSPRVRTLREALSLYPLVKSELETEIASAAGSTRMSVVVLRPGILFGESRPPAKRMVSLGDLSLAVVAGWGRNRLPYVQVDDVADAVVACVNGAPKSGVFNLVPAVMVPQVGLLRSWARSRGVRCIVAPVPPWLAVLADALKRRLRHLLGLPVWPSIVRYQIATGTRDILYSAARAESELGWRANRTLALLARRK